jgi:rfaE bifunctional protein kinase chain/domain
MITTDPPSLLRLADALTGRRVLVVGDVLLDEYLIGRAGRLSREAPIPVLEFERREAIPGGAANPAANAAALGSKPVQIGVVGDDTSGAALRELLAGRGIDPAGLVTDPGRQTTTKTRILAHMGLRFPQQLARIDRIDRRPISAELSATVIDRVRALIADAEAVMLSDYLAGLLTAPVVAAIREACAARGLLATADAQGELEKYAGFDLVKCNAEEARRFAGRTLDSDADFGRAGRAMAASLDLRRGMLITRGADGITFAGRDGDALHVPAPRVADVYDTVGAGDTVLAVVTLALAAGGSHSEAAALANLAAGIVIRHVGNYAPTLSELRAAVASA